MPGAEAIYIEDTQRLSKEDHTALLTWCLDAFNAASSARQPFEDRWTRFYRLYRSWVANPRQGDWRSRVFMPISFFIIETILPKLVAQLPEFLVKPMGPEDVEPSKLMETVMGWAANNAGLFEQQTYAFKDSLMYGTGILKTFHKTDVRKMRMPSQMPVGLDFDMGERGMGRYETGEYAKGGELQDVTVYDGPAAESIDIFNFWPAPEATTIQDARYVIQRSFKEMSWVMKMVADKVYSFPENMEPDEWSSFDDEPHRKRLREIGMDATRDATRVPVEVLEYWQDDRCVTMLNRRVVVRAQRNPFDHGEKPYCRIVDHVVPHEFWGIGEIEVVEGLQDVYNALVNTRIDGVKLAQNSMFAVNIDHVYDQRDLVSRPGGIMRVREVGMPVNQVLQRIDIGDVTSSAFVEAEKILMMVERVTGVSAYQLGTDSTTLNKTATGVNIITEQGNVRFTLKMRFAEMTDLRRLGRHWGSILQQFMPDEMSIRITGEAGQLSFASLTPDAILGNFDYDIEPQSMAVTESLMKEQSMSLFQMLSQTVDPATGGPAANIRQLVDDLLKAFGIKNREAYLPPPPMPPQANGFPPGVPTPEEGMQAGMLGGPSPLQAVPQQ